MNSVKLILNISTTTMLFQTLAQTLKLYEHIPGPNRELNYQGIYCEHESSGIYPATL